MFAFNRHVSDAIVMLWDLNEKKELWRTDADRMNSVEDFQFSPDGRHVVIHHGRGIVEFRESASGKIVARYPGDALAEHVGGIDFTPCGKYVLLQLVSKVGVLWDWRKGQVVRRYKFPFSGEPLHFLRTELC